MKKLAIHSTIFAVVMIGGDFALNEGKASQNVWRDLNVRAMITEGKRQAYHANASISQRVGGN